MLEFVLQHLPVIVRLARDPQKQLRTSFCVSDPLPSALAVALSSLWLCAEDGARPAMSAVMESHEFDRLRFLLVGLVSAPSTATTSAVSKALATQNETGLLCWLTPFWPSARFDASAAPSTSAAPVSSAPPPTATLSAVLEWLSARLTASAPVLPAPAPVTAPHTLATPAPNTPPTILTSAAAKAMAQLTYRVTPYVATRPPASPSLLPSSPPSCYATCFCASLA
jgi:hypothetical protein